MTESTPAYALFGVVNNDSSPAEAKAAALELLKSADLSALSPKFKARLVHLLTELKG